MNQNLRHSLATELMHTTSEGVTGKKDLEASFWSDRMVLLQCQGTWLPALLKPGDKMNAEKYIKMLENHLMPQLKVRMMHHSCKTMPHATGLRDKRMGCFQGYLTSEFT